MSRIERWGVRETDNKYTIEGIEDATVIQLRFDYAVTLCFQGHSDRFYDLRLGSPFQFFVDGNWHEVIPEELSSCHSILQLHTDTVSSSSILKDGELRMAFKSGASLVAGANEKYESWEFGMSTNNAPEESWLLICMPGGEIAVF